MFSKIKVKKSALDYFRKQARKAMPLEVQAYLLGDAISINEIKISDFIYTKQYHTQTKNSVCWTQEEFDKVKALSEKLDKKIIGDIHSHPNWDAVLSEFDYESAIKNYSLICGIVSVYDNKTRVRFWTPTSALPCEIVYI